MKILLTGAEGYIGYALARRLRECYPIHNVVSIDNRSRFRWVKNCLGTNFDERQTYSVLQSLDGELTNRDYVNEIIKIHKPDVVIHLASQPSMPYADLCWERAYFTQFNNVLMNLNLLWALKENNLKDTKYIITTTTGIPGQHYSVVPEERTMNFAGSWYHISRGFDSDNCHLAHKQWGQKILELRTSIVYGFTGEQYRFDTDPFFGTVVNRFVHQAIHKKFLTIYGDGRQTKPFISLEDCVTSLIKAIDYEPKNGFEIMNQLTECISIKTLAEIVSREFGAELRHIPNPRKENEHFKMFFQNERFLKLLGEPKQLLSSGIKNMGEILNVAKG